MTGLERWRRWAVPAGVAVTVIAWAALAHLDARARRSALPGGGSRSSARLNVAEVSALPVEAWTARFREREEKGDWAGLDALLDVIGRESPDLYRRYQLAYLQARAKIARGQPAAGRQALEPFLADGHPFRDLALYHAAQAARAEGHEEDAARLRETLVVELPKATYRLTALEDLTAYLAGKGDPRALADLATRVAGTVEAPVARDLESRVVAARAAKGDEIAIADGLRFLRGGNLADDAAERVALALDRLEWLPRYSAEDLVLIGESERNARHFDRALELLRRALPQLPARRDDLVFSIARAEFGREHYEEAEKAFLEGAPLARDGEAKANFLYNAARCAQLLGDDARAERHLTSAIGPGGRTTRASSTLTQRLRIRIQRKRMAEAQADLRTVQLRFANTHAVVEATLAYAIGMMGLGRPELALRELERIKPRLLEKKDVPEIQYWKARAVESRDPRLAGRVYLKVLRADTPTHFAFFARQRLASEPLVSRLRVDREAHQAEVQRLLDAGQVEAARRAQTDVVLLAPPDQEAAERARLAALYRRSEPYAAVLDLPAPDFPRFPLFTEGEAEPARPDLLLAMGLFDDATDLVLGRYPLHPLAQGIARAEALRRGGASRASIYAAEVTTREDVPGDYLPALLPPFVRELQYPRYFYDEVAAQSRKHGADPRLVLAIMREESRFNPRAKSAAAARGLLQFIITTAREVGQAIGLVQVSPEDLYDPRVIIQLGAKYIGDLLGQFGRDGYEAVAAYNAGPNQARLWVRLAPAAGDDTYLSVINFDETKDYVRKVMNSYERYAEIYPVPPPTGGVPAQP